MKRIFLVSGTVLLAVSSAYSQSSKKTGLKFIDMAVDMPDETQETDLLAKGQWQIEAAYLHNLYSKGSPSDIGQVLIRYGISKRPELRFLTEAGSELHKYIENTVQSTFPAAASAKILLLKDHRYLPDITLVTYLHLPFYNVEKDKKAYWSPIFLLAFKNELGKN